MRISYFKFLTENVDHRYHYNALVPGNDGSAVQAQLTIHPDWGGKHVRITQHNPANLTDDRVAASIRLDPGDDVFEHLDKNYREWYGDEIFAGAAAVNAHVRGTE